nr:MAG TPA: hypothetical protein [Caudoviricetes sp.]
MPYRTPRDKLRSYYHNGRRAFFAMLFYCNNI